MLRSQRRVMSTTAAPNRSARVCPYWIIGLQSQTRHVSEGRRRSFAARIVRCFLADASGYGGSASRSIRTCGARRASTKNGFVLTRDCLHWNCGVLSLTRHVSEGERRLIAASGMRCFLADASGYGGNGSQSANGVAIMQTRHPILMNA
jgi:hypothetical protein